MDREDKMRTWFGKAISTQNRSIQLLATKLIMAGADREDITSLVQSSITKGKLVKEYTELYGCNDAEVAGHETNENLEQ